MREIVSRALLHACFLGACLLGSCLLAACGGADVKRTVTNVSLGQQLIDLKQARDSGALSESEYQRQRNQLISDAK